VELDNFMTKLLLNHERSGQTTLPPREHDGIVVGIVVRRFETGCRACDTPFIFLPSVTKTHFFADDSSS